MGIGGGSEYLLYCWMMIAEIQQEQPTTMSDSLMSHLELNSRDFRKVQHVVGNRGILIAAAFLFASSHGGLSVCNSMMRVEEARTN